MQHIEHVHQQTSPKSTFQEKVQKEIQELEIMFEKEQKANKSPEKFKRYLITSPPTIESPKKQDTSNDHLQVSFNDL